MLSPERSPKYDPLRAPQLCSQNIRPRFGSTKWSNWYPHKYVSDFWSPNWGPLLWDPPFRNPLEGSSPVPPWLYPLGLLLWGTLRWPPFRTAVVGPSLFSALRPPLETIPFGLPFWHHRCGTPLLALFGDSTFGATSFGTHILQPPFRVTSSHPFGPPLCDLLLAYRLCRHPLEIPLVETLFQDPTNGTSCGTPMLDPPWMTHLGRHPS
jgi:hypothetical protein